MMSIHPNTPTDTSCIIALEDRGELQTSQSSGEGKGREAFRRRLSRVFVCDMLRQSEGVVSLDNDRMWILGYVRWCTGSYQLEVNDKNVVRTVYLASMINPVYSQRFDGTLCILWSNSTKERNVSQLRVASDR